MTRYCPTCNRELLYENKFCDWKCYCDFKEEHNICGVRPKVKEKEAE